MIDPQAKADFYNRCAALGGWQPVRDPFYSGLSAAFGYSLNSNATKPARPKDLTPRQIEWCRANLSSFMPKVINAPR